VSDGVDLLGVVFSEAVLRALDARIRDLVAEGVREELARQQPMWVPVEQAAPSYGCSAHALRQRAKRGTVEVRRKGRRLYVRANPGESGDRSQ
jgi:hypothetical protein